MCSLCDECSHGGCREAGPTIQEKKNVDGWHHLNCQSALSQISAVSIMMPERSNPNAVYRRKKPRDNSQSRLLANGTDCVSLISSNSHLVEDKENDAGSQHEHESEMVGNIVNGGTSGKGHGFDETLNSSLPKNIEADSINDSCSSSKSNIELVSASTKVGVDDTGECSSSSMRVMEHASEDISGRDMCISILRSNGLLSCIAPATVEDGDLRSDNGCSRLCKSCGYSDLVLKMLICDHCEDAFHVSCCNHRMKKVPNDEWYCNSCLRKKHKILKNETISRKLTNITSRNGSSKSGLSSIALMLKDTEPYTTGVRIGKGFQAEVPDWIGPIHDDTGALGEPLGMDSSESLRVHEHSTNKPCRLSSIGNWLQCQQVMDGGGGVNGTVCGKWRRAPLFEVQSDDWECFCSILWDPSHADCAVPQELETSQVLKQLKYIEMLRPRLSAKRRKLDESKSRGDLQNLTTVDTELKA